MNITKKYIIELSVSEAMALKKWLGKLSDLKGKEVGISQEGNNFLSKLYESLPHEDATT